MKWSDPSLISLSANARGQGVPACDVGSGYEASGCNPGSTYGQGCIPGVDYGIVGTPCATLGNQATGDCSVGVGAIQPTAL